MDGDGSCFDGRSRRRALQQCGLRQSPRRTGLPARGLIEVEFANGSRMRITGAVDPATLTTTIATLAGGGGRR
jgi:hypothetical protein